MTSVPPEGDAETTAPLPVVRVSPWERLTAWRRHAFRVETKTRTFDGPDAWEPDGPSVFDNPNFGHARSHSMAWPFIFVVVAIITGAVARMTSPWIIPYPLAALIVIFLYCEYRIDRLRDKD